MGEKRKLDSPEDSPNPGPSNLPDKRRVIGPALPPQSGDSTPSGSDSEDDFGPSLPPADGVAVEPVNNYKSSVPSSDLEESQRDQWMLQPPAQTDWATKIDPTHLRSRKFQTGKSAKSIPSKTDASWVESPEDRIRRLQDEVMGVAATPNARQDTSSAADGAKSMEKKILKYRDMTGKNARLEHSGQSRKEEDDPSLRAFDREKDMAISSKVSHAKRREMVNKAGDYSTRFSKGSFL